MNIMEKINLLIRLCTHFAAGARQGAGVSMAGLDIVFSSVCLAGEQAAVASGEPVHIEQTNLFSPVTHNSCFMIFLISGTFCSKNTANP